MAVKVVKYLRELSIVIIGVAVTLAASSIVNDFKEKRDLKQQLNIIHAELESNVERLDGLIDFYGRHGKLSNFLIESIENPQTGTIDSINKYSSIIGEIYPFTYKRGAYDMFLNSGAAKLLTDRNLLLDITESYTMLEIIKGDYDKYVEMKIIEIQKFNDLGRKNIYNVIDITSPEYSNMFNFYTSIRKGEYPVETREHIEKVLLHIK